ncbi:MAG: NUDIX domain-containing protein [Anaerolineales bacterium]|nr:NUDIX domain-containing protein [Anaerolineales bacterium]
MPDDQVFFRSIRDKKQHRPGGRAIIFDSTRQYILVERNLGAHENYDNFPGGGLELGETLQECISREMKEEIGATVLDFEFLFLVENFILFEGEYLHGLELYCEVRLESDEVESQEEGYECLWIEVASLCGVDLRPHIVRDRIIDGTYRDVRHLVTRN